MADHNDPNAVNTIFSDIDVSAADVYDMFGYPGPGGAAGETVVIALTFAAVPSAGVLDTDMLYRLQLATRRRVTPPDDWSFGSLMGYVDGVREKYLNQLHAAEIRMKPNDDRRTATLAFSGFPGGREFQQTVELDSVTEIATPGGHRINAFVGGRDDAFFNDLTGFFRSINYAPQFYHVPHTRPDLRELPIPKTLIELEGNHLFNFDPANPDLGHLGVKADLPPGPYTWSGDSYRKDADGNFRFVYTGIDAQAGKNVNALILELPLAFLTTSPEQDRVVEVWGESWVLKAADKVDTIPDHPLWIEHPRALLGHLFGEDRDLDRYKLVDTVGQPFADAGLSEREDRRQLGANNFWLAPHFVKRLAHLGWGFGPSITALGLETAFDHDNSPISVHRTYGLAIEAFPRVRKMLFQELPMPDDSWNPHNLDIGLRRAFEIFVPNVNAIDMDTTGSWPFGRRLEDQVATRFLGLFLDMQAKAGGRPYHLELLGEQALWDAAPIVPRTPPNPLKNDTEFLTEFPYLAEPHPEQGAYR
ncbi:MAG: DUF4331 family protein [Gaiellales bacterium]